MLPGRAPPLATQLRHQLKQRRRGGSSSYVTTIEKVPRIARIVSTLLPTTSSLLEWVESRAFEDFDIMEDKDGDVILGLMHRSSEDRQARVHAFFDSLPGDELTEEECGLRGALLDFLEKWPQTCSPKLRDVAAKADIQKARNDFLPDEIGLSLWINHQWPSTSVGHDDAIPHGAP